MALPKLPDVFDPATMIQLGMGSALPAALEAAGIPEADSARLGKVALAIAIDAADGEIDTEELLAELAKLAPILLKGLAAVGVALSKTFKPSPEQKYQREARRGARKAARAEKQGVDVYSHEGCQFAYCPSPKKCKRDEVGCKHLS